MPDRDLQRIAAFRAAFARRQAAEVVPVPGGSAVLNPAYAGSHEHNQIVIDGTPEAEALPAVADRVLGHLGHRRFTFLDDAVGRACAPALTAAGYAHEPELVMRYEGTAPAAPRPPAEQVTLDELRPALVRQLRIWMPRADETMVRHLTDRRLARLRGADQVRFLAVRDEDGEVGSWADLYLDQVERVAQIEEVVTADSRVRRGYAGTTLGTALHLAAGCGLVFLIADPDDWPRTWYARRGFRPVGDSHVFTRTTGN